MGPDDYNLPGYFGKRRWNYYRLRAEGHNTLTIDDENQEPAAKAPLIAYGGDPPDPSPSPTSPPPMAKSSSPGVAVSR